MAAGRCAGCGLIDRSARKVMQHVLRCPDYEELYLEHPEQALEPEEEYRRWVAEDRPGERENRKLRLIEDVEALRAGQRDRFATPADLLDEETDDEQP